MMLTLKELRSAICSLIRSKYPKPTYEVHFDNVEKSKAPYFYIELNPRARSFDDIISERSIEVDIAYFSAEDAQGNIKRSDLYEKEEELYALFFPVFYAADRAITILEAETAIVDEVMHFIFRLDFADAFRQDELPALQAELMQELTLNLEKEE